jgi:dihydrofolate reductase
MRKVFLALGIGLDGYIARPDGSVDFLFMAKDFSMAPFFASVDATIMGRKTYEVSLKMGGGSFGPSMTEYVLSRTPPSGVRKGVHFVKQSPAALIRRLRAKHGKHIWLMGDGQIAREALTADLVDEIHLGIVPVLLGEGIPLFPPGFPQRNFELLANNTYSKGLIELKYKRAVEGLTHSVRMLTHGGSHVPLGERRPSGNG